MELDRDWEGDDSVEDDEDDEDETEVREEWIVVTWLSLSSCFWCLLGRVSRPSLYLEETGGRHGGSERCP